MFQIFQTLIPVCRVAQQMIDSFQIIGQSGVPPLPSVEDTTIVDTDTQELSTTTDLDNQSQQQQQQEPFNDTSILTDTDTAINSTNPDLTQGQPASIVINLTGDRIVPPVTTEATGVVSIHTGGRKFYIIYR